MGLTDVVRRAGAARPHVLLVAPLGGTVVRLAVEADIARRRWPTAFGPADADLLVVAGEPGEEMTAVLDRVEAQVPLPRARVDLRDPAAVRDSLDTAARRLVVPGDCVGAHTAGGAQGGGDRRDPTDGRSANRCGESGAAPAPGTEHGDHRPHGESGEHSEGGEHGGHGGEMQLPGGLAMADLGEDRDGLLLDQLHVSFGPVLPDWPHGLVLDTVLQGDVIQQARPRLLAPARRVDGSFWHPPGGPDPDRDLARRLDGIARFLGVAGWPAAAAAARALRDDVLAGVSADSILARVESLVRRVRRSRVLRRMLRGVRGANAELPEMLGRALMGLHCSAGVLAGHGSVAEQPPSLDGGSGRVLERLAGQLGGAELAAARLIVAVVDPDLDAIAAAAPDPVRADGSRNG